MVKSELPTMKGCENMVLNISIPDSVILSTRQTTYQFEAEAKKAIALKFYADEKLSVGQAAELANLTEPEFLKLMGQNNISLFRFEDDEDTALEDDVDMAMRYANA